MANDLQTNVQGDRAKARILLELPAPFRKAFEDARTVEIMLNTDGQLWAERLGEGMEVIGQMTSSQATSIIKTVAGFHGKSITETVPFLECKFPIDDSRFAAQIPPIVSSPVFALRKRASAIFTLDQYVESEIMTTSQAAAIRTALKQGKNIIVAGGTGSGKTTLVNAVIKELVLLGPSKRILMVEDTGEIQCPAANQIAYATAPTMGMREIVRLMLRMRPDSIVVGEVRGAEALDMLSIWGSGHGNGIATVHANTARKTLPRLEMLVSMNPDAPRPIPPLIGDAIQLIIYIQRTPEGSRKVSEIMELTGYENGQYQFHYH